MSKILDNLWIANIHEVRNKFFLLYTTKATHILNCTDEFPLNYPIDIVSERIPLIDLDDEYQESNTLFIEESVELLDSWLGVKENRVIVHCAAGISRSPTVVLAWLIRKRGMSFTQAFDFVYSKRDIIRPNEFFLDLLKKGL